jgi:hypothetical protein
MARWRLSTTIKKCISEYQVYEKGDERISIEHTWRWGDVIIVTEDDTPPDIDLSEDANIDVTCIENSEINMLEDNCGSYVDGYPLSWIGDEDFQDIFFGDVYGDMYGWLDDNGWECMDSEIYFEGPLALERIG